MITKNPIKGALLLFTIVSGIASVHAQGVVRAFVVKVDAGDALTVKESKGKLSRLQLMGVEAPAPVETFSVESKQALTKLALGKSVKFIPSKIERNGRTVANVVLEPRGSLSIWQLQEGTVW